MKKERPILFSTPMVQAILAGNKTMTRRVVKSQPYETGNGWWSWDGPRPKADRNSGAHAGNRSPDQWSMLTSPYGSIGDIMWVRETFKPKYIKGCLQEYRNQYPTEHPWFYITDGATEIGYGSWKPSIHMPKAACRIWLEITDVRMERLQDISEEDAKAEGVEKLRLYPGYNISPKGKFEGLWNLINGDESWDANPWVWVIKFKVISEL